MKPIAWGSGIAAVALMGTAVYIIQREPEPTSGEEGAMAATKTSASALEPRVQRSPWRRRSASDRALNSRPALGADRDGNPLEAAPPVRAGARPTLGDANEAHGGEIPAGAAQTGQTVMEPPPGPTPNLDWLDNADDENPREQALDALDMYVAAGAANELAPVLESLRSTDPNERLKGIRELADMSDTAFIPVFDALRYDEDPQVRAEISRALDRLQERAG